MVKVDGSYEMSDERKKLDYEVYPHMVEQLIEKIKEQRERKPEAKERFDKIIARLKKLAKVSHLPYLQRPTRCFVRHCHLETISYWYDLTGCILANIRGSRRIRTR